MTNLERINNRLKEYGAFINIILDYYVNTKQGSQVVVFRFDEYLTLYEGEAQDNDLGYEIPFDFTGVRKEGDTQSVLDSIVSNFQ